MSYLKNHSRISLFLLALVLSLVGLSLSGWRIAISRETATATSGQNSLPEAFNPEGSSRADVIDSFEKRGFRMEVTAAGAPCFVPAAACSGWDTQFAPPNGVNGTIKAMVASGTDIYVGGNFTTAGNVAANNVAKFSTLTNTWSALGTCCGNGVNNSINAMLMNGSDLYVGGHFTTANVGATTVSVNKLAKFNTMTGVWSAVGTGVYNGVIGNVFSLAMSGTDLFVGGIFTKAGDVAASCVAKFNGLTNKWSALGTGGGNGVNGNVQAMVVSGSDLFVGGGLTIANVGGAPISVSRLAKVNTTTGVWSVLGTDGNGVDSVVNALALSGSDLYVGGVFTKANVGGTIVPR